jgi:hypothetical protein
MKQSIMKPAWLCLLLYSAGLLCTGCISRKATYPDSWSRANPVPAAECPKLAGRYANAGEVAAGTPLFSCASRSRFRGEWCGETSLSRNVGDLASTDWVELRQPNKDTLVVVSSDPTVPVKELHQKKGDFRCSDKGLERQLHTSALSFGDNSNETSAGQDVGNAIGAAFGAATQGSGGVRTLTRRFSVADDGSLVMAVSQSEGGLLFLIPYHEHYETFVHWAPVAPPSEDAAAAGAVATGGAPSADLPSAHVGLFEPTNGSMWSKVKVTNLDGSPVNTYAGQRGAPIAMQPGRHWVQVTAKRSNSIPPRDLDTKYAFEMEAVAGHRYRIPRKPSTCLAPGNIDAALASASVYHARLSIIDDAPGSGEQTLDVDSLCVTARSYVCVPLAAAAGASPDGQGCVRLADWRWGYYGKDAGVLPVQ